MDEVGMSVSEEEMIDSLFYRCDTLGEGRVYVYTVIQFLKNCLGNGNNEPDLLELSSILESSCIDGKIDLSCYRQAVKHWVTEIRHRCESTSFLEPDGPLNSSYNSCNNSTDRSLCIETSGIGDGSFHKTEDEIGELLQELEDLKFQNRKLGEEQTQLRCQIDTQEEVTTNLTTELQNKNRNEDQLRKKIRSLQDLLELRQSVMDENEELKAKLFSTQELKRDLDTKVVSLERENVNLQSQVKNYESKWQKACSDLDLARNELQQLNTAHLEQKDLLVSLQDAKSTQEEAFAEKNEELAALKERLNQFMEHNEKLQEEKEDFQLRLAQMDGKLQRYQTKVEQLGLSDESITGNQNLIEKSKISPRLRFSTPLPKNSICMELKDRLNEDKNLPSPFCEKLELSTDVNYHNRKSALLPTYMSAWDFEVSNRSYEEYSLELLKHRKSLGPEIYDSDLEKKLEGLKDLEKDGLQREIIRLYRANVELAEKCHKSELKEAELREVLNDTSLRCELDRQKYHQLENSLESSKEAREVDLKDLWRLVHSPDEEDTSESDCSLSASTEQLKEQIRKEIEALKNKLNKKQKTLSTLKLEKSKIHPLCKKRASNSPLVEALNIDLVSITKKHPVERSGNFTCQCESKVHKCNRSVPLIRKRNRQGTVVDDYVEIEIGDVRNLDSESSDIETEVFGSKEDLDKMHRKDIPERFKSGSTSDSELVTPKIFDSSEHLKTNLDDMIEGSSKFQKLEDFRSSNNTYSNTKDFELDNFESQEQNSEQNSDKGIQFRKPVNVEHSVVHRGEGHAMLRSQSYRKAIENHTDSLDEAPRGRDRSDSFQNAIEQGQVSPTSLSDTVAFSESDKTPEYESCDSLLLSTAPKFSSTPLPVSAVRSAQVNLLEKNNKDIGLDGDIKHGGSQLEVDSVLIDRQPPAVQVELFKADGLKLDKLSPTSTHCLPILPEEDSDVIQDSFRSHSINSECNSTDGSQLSIRNHSQQPNPEKTTLSGFDCSAEVWTLSGSSEHSPSASASCDSGHSSSITSFEKANISALNAINTHSSLNSSKSQLKPGSPLCNTTSDCIPSSMSTETSQNFSSSLSVLDSQLDNGTQFTEEIFSSSNVPCNNFKSVTKNQNNAVCDTLGSKLTGELGVLDVIAGDDKNTDKDKGISSNNKSNKNSKSWNGRKNIEIKVSAPTESKEKPVPNKTWNHKLKHLNLKLNRDIRYTQCPKRSFVSNSYQNERNLSPSERILQRSAANKLSQQSDVKQNDTNHVHLPNRITDVKPVDPMEPDEAEISDGYKKELKLEIDEPELHRAESDSSDTNEPPAICFFKVSENGMKHASTDQNKITVVNGLGTSSKGSQVLVPEEGSDHCAAGDSHRLPVTSSLSKIRENHLAKRRDYIRQNKMPQLSELSEKDSPENNNEQKNNTAPVMNMKEEASQMVEANGDIIMPSIPDEFLQKLDLTAAGKSSEELSDQEIESKFTSLSLAFKTDSQTLEKRLEIQERSRDIAEQNVDKELQGLRTCLQTLNQICTDPQVREVLTKIQNHVDVLEKSTARVSSRAEVFGAIQQEKRMSKAVDIMVHHVENIRRVHEREHAELEEARKLLQDSRSLAPTTIDISGGDMRRSVSVCQNNMFGTRLSPQGAPTTNPLTPSTAKAIKILKASRRRVSEIALPKVLGGTGAATLHPSASMDSFYLEPYSSRVSVSSLYRAGPESSIEEDEGNMHTAHLDSDSNSLHPYFEADARSRFKAVIASTTVKSAVANTLRRASLEKQNHVQSVSPSVTPRVSRDNSAESSNKLSEAQDKEKQKNLEEEAFKKGYEQGMRASLGQDLSNLREQQNNINESLGEIMDAIDNQVEEPKSLKEVLVGYFNETVPKIKISGWRIRMTMGCFFIVMAILSVIVSLFPVGSATILGYRHYGRPPT